MNDKKIKDEIDKLMEDVVGTFYQKLEELIHIVLIDMDLDPLTNRNICKVNIYPYSEEYIYKVGIEYQNNEIATLTMTYDEEDENDPKFVIIPESKFQQEENE